MYYADYHTHSRLSPDSKAPLREMALAALNAGLSELCVTDHYDLVTETGAPAEAAYDWTPAVEQWVSTAEEFRGRLTLKLGLEFGSLTFDPARAKATVEEPRLDFVIGSLHNLTAQAGGRDFYFVDYDSPQTCYAALDDYFSHMRRLAPLAEYDALGHLIYPLRYMCMRDGQTVTLERYRDEIREILRLVAQTGHAMEVNTYNGRTLEEWREVLSLYREVGGELVTVGSDAHRPGNVARGIRAACALIAQAGFRYLTLYEKRRPKPVKIG